MLSPTPDQWFAQITPAVAAFRSGCFELGSDLRRLRAVRDDEAVEATVFYAARILDALAADALARVRIEPSPNVFSNLVTLQQYSLLTTGAIYSTHPLRRLGNAARHIQEELTAKHAEISLALAERVLEWFFIELSVGPQIDGLGRTARSISLAGDAALANTLSTAENVGRTWPDGWAELRQQQGTAIAELAQAAAIVAEIWLDRDKIDAARDLLADALAKNADDLRLQQLMLLVASRMHEFEAAREQIDRLMQRNPDDEETLGIAGGAYKRMWQNEPTATEWLAKSQQCYRAGWKISKRQTAYLGINAATTALWLGCRDESQQLAADIEQLLNSRSEQLKKSGFPHVRPDYWTQAMLAEALLLQEKSPQALAAFKTAVSENPESAGSIKSTRDQLQSIGKSLKLPGAEIDEFLE